MRDLKIDLDMIGKLLSIYHYFINITSILIV